MFGKLEDEGIIVPEEVVAILPPELCLIFNATLVKKKHRNWKPDKLTWESSYVPFSVSICSNVPCYQTPKFFVTNGDPKGIISEFIQYLFSISRRSSSLLLEQYAGVFAALNNPRGLESRESNEDQLAQIGLDI